VFTFYGETERNIKKRREGRKVADAWNSLTLRDGGP
jgi:hypothetical protein